MKRGFLLLTKTEVTVSISDMANDKKDCWKVHCSEYIISTLKAANRALNYSDFGKRYRYGTLRNEISNLARDGKILVLPKECPGRFILRNWAPRPEYSCIVRNDVKGTAGRFDFLSYLERLDWTSRLAVHNLKLGFSVYQLQWLGAGWTYCKKSKSFSRSFGLSYPVSVQCFDTGSVLVGIRCSCKPFQLDLNGLLALSSLLGEVRNALKAPCIPDPMTWSVAQWHLNRDSEALIGGGLDVNLTFRDFFDDSAQFYYKRELGKMRAEVNQNPKRTIKELFETILDRSNAGKGGSEAGEST
jgi:hypothetical protein